MNSVRLVQFTDTHLLADPLAQMRGAAVQPRLRACVAHARRRFFPTDAIALTGDLVHDEAAGYDVLTEIFSEVRVPIMPIAGNHDLPQEMRRRLNRPPFTFAPLQRIGPWSIVLLESWFAGSTDGEGELGHQQLLDLERLLQECRNTHTLVLLHHPPILMDAPGLDDLRLMDGPQLLAMIARHPHVRGVAWGHAHQALDRLLPGDVRLMCTPATCMQFKPYSPNFEVDDRPPGYRVMDLRADGSIATEVVWLEGYRD